MSRPLDVDGGGKLVQVLQDPHGVPGVEAPVDEDHVGDIGPEAAVLHVGSGNVAGQLLRSEILPESFTAKALEEVQRQGVTIEWSLLSGSY